jgi:hypothetical protein
MWLDAEETAIHIGLNLDYFWEINPKIFRKYVSVFHEKEKLRIKEIDELNYKLAIYIGYAVNKPSGFPSKPFLREGEATKKEMTSEQMEAAFEGIVKRVNAKNGANN